MANLFSDLRGRLAKRTAYNNTVAELRNMPLGTAIDLEIFRDDAEKLATQAVYGR